MALKRRGAGQFVRPGDMTHQLKILRDAGTDDGQGGLLPGTDSTAATVWGNLMPINASRAQSYGLTMTNKPVEIDMYWYDNYVPTEDDKLQVVETGEILHVHSVLNVDAEYFRCKVLAIKKG